MEKLEFMSYFYGYMKQVIVNLAGPSAPLYQTQI